MIYTDLELPNDRSLTVPFYKVEDFITRGVIREICTLSVLDPLDFIDLGMRQYTLRDDLEMDDWSLHDLSDILEKSFGVQFSDIKTLITVQDVVDCIRKEICK